jgi:hypothetical protein
VPLLLAVPVAAIIAADSSSVLGSGAARSRPPLFLGFAALIVPAIWVLLFWTLVSVFPNEFRRVEPLADAIRAAGGAQASVIVDRTWTAGQLRIHEPAWVLYAAELGDDVALPPASARPGPCVIVWRSKADAAPPAAFVKYVQRIRNAEWAIPGAGSVLVESAPDGNAGTETWRVESLPAAGLCGLEGTQLAGSLS